MRIVVSGASGSIGSALVPYLRAEGHTVLTLVRRPEGGPDEIRWDPARGELDPAALAGVDAAVNLSGPGVAARRWNDAYKREIRQARVDATRTLSTALAVLDPLPQVLVSGSAIGFYGDTADAAVDESAPPGTDALAETCVAWEAATEPAERAGMRVVHLRTGVVQARRGGLLDTPVPVLGLSLKLGTVFKLGLGGRLGSGSQWISWIGMHDEVRAIAFALHTTELAGPVNATAPEPVTNQQWTRAVGRALHRPTPVPVPAVALRLAIGEFADLGALVSQRVLPRRLQQAGFSFDHPRLDEALAAELG